MLRAPVIAFVLLLACVPGVRGEEPPSPTSVDEASGVELLVGYSFGGVNGIDTGTQRKVDNEPLVALRAHSTLSKGVRAEVLLGTQSFGRLVESLTASSEGDSLLASPRRSIICDGSLSCGWQSASLVLNAGFIFDAQFEDDDEDLSDASSYFLVGPRVVLGPTSANHAMLDLLFGHSEVMTGRDVFSHSLDRDTLRFRPRLRFNIVSEKLPASPLSIGIWADIGSGDRFGDTYVLYFASDILRSDKPTDDKESESRDVKGR